jgi:hypothetical protein
VGLILSSTARTPVFAATAFAIAIGIASFASPTPPPPAPASTPSGTAKRVISPGALPSDLAGTGLYADWPTRTVAPTNRPFTPQYPLWTDGAHKQRWIYLPPGSTIDASQVDAWQFPVGTKVWKQFSFGSPAETRYMERGEAGWRFATYVWSADGKTATLAEPRGARAAAEVAPGIRHAIPGEADCRLCHGTGKTPLLGFSALQLSADRDPNALHAEVVAPGSLELSSLSRNGLLRGFHGSTSPRIAARSPIERAALGYLHGNCGHCHRQDGALGSIGMVLSSPSAPHDALGANAVLTTTRDRASLVAPGQKRIAPGDAEHSVLFARMRSREPSSQMPPLGTQVADEDGLHVMASWIDQLAN